jgi:hypothetical protein
MIPTIRDKDAAPACMMLAALHQRLRARGQNLLDYYVAILEHLGGYDNVNRSLVMQGADGILKKDRIMESLRKSPPKRLGGEPVQRVLDYWNEAAFGPFVSPSDRLPRDVVQLQTDAFVATIRPSGTEPKLKLYLQLLPGDEARGSRAPFSRRCARVPRRSRGRSTRICCAHRPAPRARRAAAARHRRPRAQARVPGRTLPALRAALIDSRLGTLDALLDWLRGDVAAMTPGSDPLPALKEPIAFLRRLGGVCATPLRSALAAWAARERRAAVRGGAPRPARRTVTVIGGGTGSFHVLTGLRELGGLEVRSIVDDGLGRRLGSAARRVRRAAAGRPAPLPRRALGRVGAAARPLLLPLLRKRRWPGAASGTSSCWR